MTEKSKPYRISLDPCIRTLSRPQAPDLNVPAHDLPAEQRVFAEAVARRAFVTAGAHLEMPPLTWEEDAERRTVRLWGLIELSVSLGGIDFRVKSLAAGGNGPPVDVDLRRPIGQAWWAHAFDPVIAAAFEAHGAPRSSLQGPVAKYVRRVLLRSFAHYVDWGRLRRSVLRCLHPDALVLALTRRTFDGDRLTPEAFNWAARNQRTLALIAIEHPGLLPFMRLMTYRDGVMLRKAFEDLLREKAITPAALAKLETWGYAPFDAAFQEIRTGDVHRTVADVANAFERIGVPESPAACFGAMVARGLEAHAPDWFLRATWQEVCDLEQYDPEEPPIPGDFDDAIAWIATGPRVDRNQERAGWPWIVRQATAHRHAGDAAACIEWRVPCGTRAIDGHAVVPLRCPRDLVDEAAAMRNCLDTMADDCREGRIAAFSVRKGGRRLACFTLTFVSAEKPFWQVLEVAGRANSPAPEMAGIAARLASALTGTGRPASRLI